MSAILRPYPSRRALRAQRGQTLIIALAVLFVLLFIGGLFVTQIARNLTTAGRSRETTDAQALAEAGIRYCDAQLTNSEEGADWRPAPTAPNTTTGANGPDPLGLTDPDYRWLSQGFTRIEMRGGRALVRVSYDPHVDDPRSQLIRIDSVGRPGELGQGLDPTVFVQNGNAPRLRRELVAYKQIGLTDYLRFITNKDRGTTESFLGTPNIGRAVASVFGDPTIALHPDGKNNNEILFGGAIRSNANLRFMGDVFVYASPRGQSVDMTTEGVQVAGDLRINPTRNTNNNGGDPNDDSFDDNDQQVFMNQDITALAPDINKAVRPSADAKFDTLGGLVRDSSTNPDAKGYTRQVPRLDPPVLDNFVSGSGVSRYRALTRDSGRWINVSAGNTINTGQFGWGRGIYVDNATDVQNETTTPGVNGSYSLRADWTNPNAGFATGYWQGPYYRPPGLTVELLGNRIRLTRSDTGVFRNINGGVVTQSGGKVVEIPLSDFDRRSIKYTLGDGTVLQVQALDHDGDEPKGANDPQKPYGDQNSYGVSVTLLAEGNVRVRGVYGALTNLQEGAEPNPDVSPDSAIRKVARVHLTIVSGGTAYIDGNIVKGDGYVDATKPAGQQVVLERASTCAILARNYVCVNTTMFMSPQNQTNVFSRLTPDLDAFSTEVGQSRQTYDASFAFGVNPATYQTSVGGVTTNSVPYLMLRHAALAPGPTYINLLINPGLAQVDAQGVNNSFYPFNANADLVPNPNNNPSLRYIYPLGLKYQNGQNLFFSEPEATTPNFEQKAFGLADSGQYGVGTFQTQVPGLENILRFQLDQTAEGQLNQSLGVTVGSGGSTPYLLGNLLVAPLDIRIEALLYAQERSFFVIPGYTFNPNPNDTREAFVRRGYARTSYTKTDSANDRRAKDLFPFYREPMDVRITIYGAVAENYTASMGDQKAWMEAWGYTPAEFGSTGPNPVNPGLTAIRVPDDHLGGHDPDGYIPGEARNMKINPLNQPYSDDFRTPYEKQTQGLDAKYKDIEIARGLRFVYDPALAMPYQHPTGVDLTANVGTRATRALRAIVRPEVKIGNNVVMPKITQTLPSVPRLPVCPGLLYFGDSDRPVVP